MIVKAMAWGVYKQRRDIGNIVWGWYQPAKKIGITVLCDSKGGKDLVPVTIWNAHELEVEEIATFFHDKVNRAKQGTDKKYEEAT